MKYQRKKSQAKRKVKGAKREVSQSWSSERGIDKQRKELLKIAKQMRKGENIVGAKFIKDEQGHIKAEKEVVLERWRRYFKSIE